MLVALGRIAGISGVYASPAVGPEGQPDFLNAAVLVVTDLEPQAVRDRLRRIEADLGRVRVADRYAARPVDLDLVLYDNQILNTPPLRIPDPDLLDRGYLAVTISELDPDFIHPETGETLGEIAARLRAESGIVHRPEIHLTPQTGPENPPIEADRRGV